MSTTKIKSKAKAKKPLRRLTAAEMRQLTPAKRSAIWRAAAKLAEPYYREGSPLRDFDAFGENDLYVDSSNTETG